MAKGTFAKAMPHVFSEEGGYVDHEKDPGGATNMGITLASQHHRSAYPRHGACR